MKSLGLLLAFLLSLQSEAGICRWAFFNYKPQIVDIKEFHYSFFDEIKALVAEGKLTLAEVREGKGYQAIDWKAREAYGILETEKGFFFFLTPDQIRRKINFERHFFSPGRKLYSTYGKIGQDDFYLKGPLALPDGRRILKSGREWMVMEINGDTKYLRRETPKDTSAYQPRMIGDDPPSYPPAPMQLTDVIIDRGGPKRYAKDGSLAFDEDGNKIKPGTRWK